MANGPTRAHNSCVRTILTVHAYLVLITCSTLKWM